MKYLLLLVCLLHATPGESSKLRRELGNSKGTKRSASSARGKPKLFREDPNVCVCVNADGIVLSQSPDCNPDETECCDLNTDEINQGCGSDDDTPFLASNCYERLMNLEYEDTAAKLDWDTIRDDILALRQSMMIYGLDITCAAELDKMVAAEDAYITKTPKFQATIGKLVVAKRGEKAPVYRSSAVIVDIVGPQRKEVSDISVDICFKDQCSRIGSSGRIGDADNGSSPPRFDKQISHTFASVGLSTVGKSKRVPSSSCRRLKEDGTFKVMGDLLRSNATYTAKGPKKRKGGFKKLNLETVGAPMYEFLEGGAEGIKRIADFDITFKAYGKEVSDEGELVVLYVKKTLCTASFNKKSDIVMFVSGIPYGDILIGGEWGAENPNFED